MNLIDILAKLKSATSAKDIFGDLTGTVDEKLKELKSIFRQLAKVTHADLLPKDQQTQANEAFQELNKWNEIAEQEIKNGNYGAKKVTVVSFKKSVYHLTTIAKTGDLADIFFATEANKTKTLAFKLAKASLVNELIKNEAKTLLKIGSYDGDAKNLIKNHVVHLINSFEVNGRHANLFEFKDSYYSLEEVIQAYPDGVEPRHFAWMFRRLLSALIGVHAAGYVHGAVTPAHFLINPADHNGVLIDFCYSVKKGEKLINIVPKYKSNYPAEVLLKEKVDQKTDIYMAVRVMERLLGKKTRTGDYPKTVPRSIRNFIASCLIENHYRRPNNSLDIYNEFSILLEDLWGKPKWVDLKMPPNVG